jgi:excisionase family DNA binding protein
VALTCRYYGISRQVFYRWYRRYQTEGPAMPAKPRAPLRHASTAWAAERAGVNQRTILRYIARGRLTGYRVGPKLIKVDLDEVDALFRPIPAGGSGSDPEALIGCHGWQFRGTPPNRLPADASALSRSRSTRFS